ncbi:hypothetical protein Avbf_07589 [Armadillidium vulgare]|nr:hypothetical protein Avbf_07589 [Armadillidium vulgare]
MHIISLWCEVQKRKLIMHNALCFIVIFTTQLSQFLLQIQMLCINIGCITYNLNAMANPVSLVTITILVFLALVVQMQAQMKYI